MEFQYSKASVKLLLVNIKLYKAGIKLFEASIIMS